MLNAIKDTQNVAISLQRQQLEDGYNSEDQEIGRYKLSSELIYISGGRKSNKPKEEGELFNFDDTGSFLGGLEIQFTKDDAIFWSTDDKTDELVGKYRNIFGLDSYNHKNYILNSVLPIFIQSIKKELKLI